MTHMAATIHINKGPHEASLLLRGIADHVTVEFLLEYDLVSNTYSIPAWGSRQETDPFLLVHAYWIQEYPTLPELSPSQWSTEWNFYNRAQSYPKPSPPLSPRREPSRCTKCVMLSTILGIPWFILMYVLVFILRQEMNQ